MNKNRKQFIAVIQTRGSEPGARVYRIKRNKPVYLGFVGFLEQTSSVCGRDNLITSFLKYQGHVKANHRIGDQFSIEAV